MLSSRNALPYTLLLGAIGDVANLMHLQKYCTTFCNVPILFFIYFSCSGKWQKLHPTHFEGQTKVTSCSLEGKNTFF